MTNERAIELLRAIVASSENCSEPIPEEMCGPVIEAEEWLAQLPAEPPAPLPCGCTTRTEKILCTFHLNEQRQSENRGGES